MNDYFGIKEDLQILLLLFLTINWLVSQGLLWKQEGLALRNQELTWGASKYINNNKD